MKTYYLLNRNYITRQHLPVVALLLATVTLLAFTPQSVTAHNEQPFHANFTTQFTSALTFPLLHLTVHGKGKATYMGTTTAFTDDQVSNLIDGSGSATYTLTAKNGDTLVMTLVVRPGGTINIEGGVLFSGSYTIIGGTGRFSGATGSGVFGGTGLFLSETTGIGAFAVVGTISFGNGLHGFLGRNFKPGHSMVVRLAHCSSPTMAWAAL
jgi:hypothetical protein